MTRDELETLWRDLLQGPAYPTVPRELLLRIRDYIDAQAKELAAEAKAWGGHLLDEESRHEATKLQLAAAQESIDGCAKRVAALRAEVERLTKALAVECTCRLIEKCERCETIAALAPAAAGAEEK